VLSSELALFNTLYWLIRGKASTLEIKQGNGNGGSHFAVLVKRGVGVNPIPTTHKKGVSLTLVLGDVQFSRLAL
jgi:hypothetical protein